ncbi:MAG: T9SS type A sorting domain-containing protein [Chitinophagales bacterium]
MKKSKQKTIFSLPAYAAFAGCFLAINKETTAQVVYVDIDPDIILDEKTETYGLDMDGNGTFDFAFLNSSFSFYTFSFGTTRLRQDLVVGPYTSANAIAGISNYTGTAYGGGYTNYYPFALIEEQLINDLQTWQTWGAQFLALRTFCEDGDLCGTAYSCQWYNYDLTQTIDGYLGVRFIDESEQTHYGWIRCDVKDEGRTLVIKAYAFELQPDYPILAGDTLSYVNINEEQNTLNANVYAFNKTLYIHINEVKKTQLEIFDVAGKNIFINEFNDPSTQISLNVFSSGIYFVTLKQENKIYSTKIIIH